MIRALSLYGYVVSFLGCCLSYDLGGRVGAALWHRDRSVAGFHQSLRRSRARHEDDWGTTPTGYLSSMCCSRGGTRAEHDSHSGLADRAGVSVGTEDLAYKSRRQLGRLGGCGSLGSTITESEGYKCNWFHGTAVDTDQGEKAEDDTGLRSRGRHGVHSRTRIHESYLDSEGGGTHWRLSSTRRRTHTGAAISVVPEDIYPRHGTLCGLRGICPVWLKSPEGQQVQDICAHCGWLRHEGTARSSKLHTMEGLLQGLHDGPPDVEHCRSSCTTCLRSLRGEVGEELSVGMASHLCGRRSGEERSSHEDEDDDQHGDPRRRITPKGMGTHETVEHRPEKATRRCRVLERTSTQPSVHGARGQPKTPIELYATGHLKEGLVAVQPTVEESGINVDTPKKNVNKVRREARKRRLASEKEELERYRKRGPEERRKRERRERKRRKGSRTEMLWMEQWEWTLRFFSSWAGVRFEGEESAPLHHLQLTRTSLEKLRSEGHVKDHDQTEDGAGHGRPREPQGGADGPKGEGRGQRRRAAEDQEKDERKRGRDDKKEREDRGRRGEDEEDPGLPEKPQEASSVEEYMEGRIFLFIHHFSGGEQDVLTEQIQRQADIEDVKIKVVSVDREAGSGDLLRDFPYKTHLKWAQRGLVDGYHAGFPCSTFSRLRWRERQGYPGPVRSKLFPYGLMTNNSRQQAECDRGTILAARAADMAKEVEAGKKPGEAIGPFSTLENPPESNHAEHLSA